MGCGVNSEWVEESLYEWGQGWLAWMCVQMDRCGTEDGHMGGRELG